jgi:hypothetical protein
MLGWSRAGRSDRRRHMVLKRPLPEFGVEIVCDGETLQVIDGYGLVIEEKPVAARTYLEISDEVGKVEAELIEAASAMEVP